MTQRTESGWRSTVAGWSAAALATTVGHPIDTIKVRVQNGEARNPIQAIRLIWRNEGPFAFYKGLVPPVLGRSWLKAVNYGTYGAVQGLIQRYCHEEGKKSHPVSLEGIAAAGFASGIAVGTVGGPIELLKIRLQMQKESGAKRLYHGTLDCARYIVRHEGAFGLFRGSVAFMLREAPYYVLYFVAFEYGKRVHKMDESTVSLFWLGGLCGTFPWVILYPMDTIKSKMQANMELRPPRLREVAQHILRTDGVRGFYRGLSAGILRAFPVHATQFIAYEYFLNAMQRRSGGEGNDGSDMTPPSSSGIRHPVGGMGPTVRLVHPQAPQESILGL